MHWQTIAQFNGTYLRNITIKNNIIVIVGSNVGGHIVNSAVIVVGKRIN